MVLLRSMQSAELRRRKSIFSAQFSIICHWSRAQKEIWRHILFRPRVITPVVQLMNLKTAQTSSSILTVLTTKKYGWLKTQSEYIIVVDGALRDRTFDTTFAEFNKWLCRLAKRARINKVLVELTGEDRIYVFDGHSGIYRDMFEYPSWSCLNDDGEPAWWEYLYWQPDSVGFPRQLAYKYYIDPDNDKRVENWIQDTKRRSGFERRH